MGQVICNGNEWGERVTPPHLFNRGITRDRRSEKNMRMHTHTKKNGNSQKRQLERLEQSKAKRQRFAMFCISIASQEQLNLLAPYWASQQVVGSAFVCLRGAVYEVGPLLYISAASGWKAC